MQLNSGQRAADLDEIYSSLCLFLDQTPEAQRMLYLARLSLLLVGEMTNKDKVQVLLQKAKAEVLADNGGH